MPVTTTTPDDSVQLEESQRRAICDVVCGHPGLEFFVLYGSRARGDGHPGSDWDFAYLGGKEVDPDALRAELVLALGTDRIDLADLGRASGLLRYRVARDAVVLHEADREAFKRFWMAAVSFWCDAEPVLRRGYDGILEGLDQ